MSKYFYVNLIFYKYLISGPTTLAKQSSINSLIQQSSIFSSPIINTCRLALKISPEMLEYLVSLNFPILYVRWPRVYVFQIFCVAGEQAQSDSVCLYSPLVPCLNLNRLANPESITEFEVQWNNETVTQAFDINTNFIMIILIMPEWIKEGICFGLVTFVMGLL